MEEVERLCDTIAIMDNGCIIAQGSLQTLQEQTNYNETLALSFESLTDKQKEQLKTAIDFPLQFENTMMTVQCPVAENLNNLLELCLKNNLKVTAITQEKANLERIFLALTGKQLRD